MPVLAIVLGDHLQQAVGDAPLLADRPVVELGDDGEQAFAAGLELFEDAPEGKTALARGVVLVPGVDALVLEVEKSGAPAFLDVAESADDLRLPAGNVTDDVLEGPLVDHRALDVADAAGLDIA